jgi:phage-related protein (TIGR01555 family)
MKSKMRVNSNILNQFGVPFESANKPLDYTIPKSIGADGKVVTPKVTTDSNGYSDGLLVNQFGINTYGNIISEFAGWGLLSLVAQNAIVRNIINTKANTATQKWGKLVYKGKDGKDIENKLKVLESRAKQLKLRETINLAHKKSILFGGCMIYPKIKGDDDRLATELIPKLEVQQGSLRYLKVIEPIYCVPTSFEASNPLSKNFYVPEIWAVTSNLIHISRMCHFVDYESPIITKPVFQFYGISLINLIMDYISIFTDMRDEVAEIISKYNLNILSTDLSAILAGNPTDTDVDSVKNRIALFNKLRTNFGTLLLDKESEDYKIMSMSLGNLDTLLQQNLEYIAAMTQIPATRLFSQSPSGFGSTGQNEVDNFEALIISEQTDLLLPHVNKVFEYIQYDCFGEYDPDIEFVFNPINEPSILDKSQVFMNYANSVMQMAGQPVLSVEEARSYLASNEQLGLTSIDVDADISELGETENDNGEIEDNPDTLG